MDQLKQTFTREAVRTQDAERELMETKEALTAKLKMVQSNNSQIQAKMQAIK